MASEKTKSCALMPLRTRRTSSGKPAQVASRESRRASLQVGPTEKEVTTERLGERRGPFATQQSSRRCVEVDLFDRSGARFARAQDAHPAHHPHAIAFERDVVAERLEARRTLDEDSRGTDAAEPMSERQTCDTSTRDDDLPGHPEPPSGTHPLKL